MMHCPNCWRRLVCAFPRLALTKTALSNLGTTLLVSIAGHHTPFPYQCDDSDDQTSPWQAVAMLCSAVFGKSTVAIHTHSSLSLFWIFWLYSIFLSVFR